MIEALFTTPIGLEEVASEDLGDHAVVAAERGRGWVRGMVEDEIHLARVVYSARGISRGILLLREAAVESLEDISQVVASIDWRDFIPPNSTFACRSSRMGEHPFTRMDMERISGASIIASLPYRPRVNLESPDVLVRVNLYGDRLFVGVDFTGPVSMDRRRYRLFNHRAALNPVIASLMVRIALDKTDGRRILDPFTGGGTILIEACHRMRSVPAGYFRKGEMGFLRLPFLKHVNWKALFDEWDSSIRWGERGCLVGMDISPVSIGGARLNSRRAEADDCLHLRLADFTRFDCMEGRFDAIVTNPPYGIRMGSLVKAKKVHRYLFSRGGEYLSEGGVMVVITPHRSLVKGWEVGKEWRVVAGGLELSILLLEPV